MGIPPDRFKFSWEVQDFVKCAGCRQVAYEPYFIGPNEHVKCAACIQPPPPPLWALFQHLLLPVQLLPTAVSALARFSPSLDPRRC